MHPLRASWAQSMEWTDGSCSSLRRRQRWKSKTSRRGACPPKARRATWLPALVVLASPKSPKSLSRDGKSGMEKVAKAGQKNDRIEWARCCVVSIPTAVHFSCSPTSGHGSRHEDWEGPGSRYVKGVEEELVDSFENCVQLIERFD